MKAHPYTDEEMKEAKAGYLEDKIVPGIVQQVEISGEGDVSRSLILPAGGSITYYLDGSSRERYIVWNKNPYA